jgi:hypothetical protein
MWENACSLALWPSFCASLTKRLGGFRFSRRKKRVRGENQARGFSVAHPSCATGKQKVPPKKGSKVPEVRTDERAVHRIRRKRLLRRMVEGNQTATERWRFVNTLGPGLSTLSLSALANPTLPARWPETREVAPGSTCSRDFIFSPKRLLYTTITLTCYTIPSFLYIIL